jgi:DNA-binding NarL/FixJ family response regulator
MAKIPLQLRREWNRRLAASGFEDIEDEKGRLKRMTDRQKPAAVMEATAAFYTLLDAYMIATKELTRLERRILELYSQGMKLDDIAMDVYRSRAYVKNKIYLHRDRILHRK